MNDVKKYDPNTDNPGRAEVYIGSPIAPQVNKTEAITNPPYQTPELGDAPEEMQKEADRIYRDLRKNQYSKETDEDKAAASGTMWKILKARWRKNQEGKWFRKDSQTQKKYDPETDRPGTAFAPQGCEPLTHGGEGSGNFGHAGRPGEVGGSGPGGGSTKPNYNPKETSHRYGEAAANSPTAHEGDFIDEDNNYISEDKVEPGYHYAHREFGGLAHTKYGGYKSIDRAKSESKDLLGRHASVVIRQGTPSNEGSTDEPDWKEGLHEVWVSDKPK